MSKHVKLKIDSSNILVDPGTTTVRQGGAIKWSIKKRDRAKLKLFKITGVENIFSDPIPADLRNKIKLHVKEDASCGKRKYTIYYKVDGDKEPRAKDPKIAVKPRRSPIPLIYTIPLALAIITFTVSYFRRIKACK